MFYFLIYPIVFTVIRVLSRLFGRVQTHGEGNVPSTGGLFYCPNHESDSDPAFLLATIPRRAWFVGKQELFKVPVAGWLFQQIHGMPIKRDSADRAALRRMEGLLRKGEPLVLFPEGRVSQKGGLLRVQPGAAMVALRAGVPIVPVGLKNTMRVMPYGTLTPRYSREPVTVEFGTPICPSEFAMLPKGERVAAMTQRLATELARLTGQVYAPTESPKESEAA